jgi:hypothetical protein
MDIIAMGLALIVGAALGAGGYRYMLKRDPAALEAWAKKLKEASHQ